MKNSTTNIVVRGFLFILLFSFAFFSADMVEAYVPDDLIDYSYSPSFSAGTWAGAAVYHNGSVCGQDYGWGSRSVSCPVTAGSVGTTETFENWYATVVNGSWGPWSTDGGASYTITAPTCTSWTYSAWPTTCPADGTQTRTVLTSSPSGCTGGSPETSGTCTYVPPPTTYTVTTSASPEAGGSVSCSGCTGVSSNTATLTAIPSTNYQISGWSISACGTSATCTTLTDSFKTITAYFSLKTYTVSSSGGGSGGTISPSTRSVTHGGTTTFTVTPGSDFVASVSGCGGSLSGITYTTGAITEACTVTASFDLAPPNLTLTANLNTTTPLPYSTDSYTLSGTITNSGGPYSGNNCWKIEYGTTVNKCWRSAGSGTTVMEATEDTGRADGVTYTYSLCANGGDGPCSSSKSLVVTKGSPGLSWSDPSAVTYGTALGSATLNATANVAGSFAYSPAAGTVLSAGAEQTLSVTFTPTDTARYNSATTEVYLTVNKASQTISFPAIGNKAVGDADFTPSATGGASGNAVTFTDSPSSVCTIVSGKVHLVAAGTCTVAASQAGNSNYNAATSVSGSFTVNPSAPSQPSVTPSTGSCGGNITLSSYGGGSGGTSFKLHRNPDANGVTQWGQVASAATLAGLPSTQTGLTQGGVYNFQVEASNAGGSSYSAIPNTATASGSCFDYSLSIPITPPTLVQGNIAVVYVSSALISAQTQGVTIALSNLPAGVSYSVAAPTSKNPPAEYEITLTAAGNATIGTRTVTVTGTPLGKTTTFSLTVAAPTVNATIASYDMNGNPANSVLAGQALEFRIPPPGGTATGPITYSNQSCGAGITVRDDAPDRNNFFCTFPTVVNNKPISATVTRQGVSANTAPKTINVTAPDNTLNISVYNNDTGDDASSGIIEELDSGANVITPSQVVTKETIDYSLVAERNFNGYLFLGWAGCDSLGWSGRRCFVTVRNGATKSVTAHYGSTNYQPKVTVSGLKVDGSRYEEKPSVFAVTGPNVYMAATFANGSTQYSADGMSYSFEYSTDEGSTYHSAAIKDGPNYNYVTKAYQWPETIPPGGSVKTWAGVNLPVGKYKVRIGAKPVNAVATSYSSPSTVIVENPPPPPLSPCFVVFENNIDVESNQDTSIFLTVKKTGCATDRWKNQHINESASINNSADKVLDYEYGGWRPWGGTTWFRDKDYYEDNGSYSFLGRANLANNSGNEGVGGSGIGTWPDPYDITNQGYSNFLYGKYGCDPSVDECPDGKAQGIYIGHGGQGTKRGLYNFNINSTFRADFKCYTEVYKSYDETSDTFVETGRWSYYVEAAVNPYMNLCFGRSGEGNYYKASCGGSRNPHRVTVQCPNGSNNTIDGSSTGVIPPPTLIEENLSLNVTSTLDNASRPGARITQVSGTLVPSDVQPLETSDITGQRDFSGTTDYKRTTDRGYTVTLEAPKNHSATTGTFTLWGGCKDTATAPGDGAADPKRQCIVEMRYDELTNGVGFEKTITANYSSALPTPVITLAEPGVCGAKVHLMWTAVSGAEGYKVFRLNSSTGVYDEINSAFVGTDFTDVTGQLTPGASYSYQVSAYAGTRKSASSASKSSTASILCPDLIVDSVTATKGGVPTTTIIDGDSIRFSAIIKNQGGATPTTFQNQFVMDGNTSNTFYTSSLFSLSGLAQNTTAPISSSLWLATNITNAPIAHSLVVCADQPPLPYGVVDETLAQETNNCRTLNFSVLPKLSATLEAGKADNTSYGSSVIVNYEDAAKLRWTIGGNPTTCAGTAGTGESSSWTTSKPAQSYTVTGNPYGTALFKNLPVNVLQINYKLNCER